MSKSYFTGGKLLFFVIACFFLSMVDYGIFSYKTPSFSDLTVSTGDVYVSRPSKGGNRFNLVVDGKRVKFSCTINTRYSYTCLDREKYDGMQAKVWWFEINSFGSATTKVIYQIEISGNNLIDYETQTKKYSEEKKSYPYIGFSLLVISIILFGIALFKENIKRK